MVLLLLACGAVFGFLVGYYYARSLTKQNREPHDQLEASSPKKWGKDRICAKRRRSLADWEERWRPGDPITITRCECNQTGHRCENRVRYGTPHRGQIFCFGCGHHTMGQDQPPICWCTCAGCCPPGHSAGKPDDNEPLRGAEVAHYRNMVAGMSYLAQDRPDLRYASLSGSRADDNPTRGDFIRMKYLMAQATKNFKDRRNAQRNIGVYGERAADDEDPQMPEGVRRRRRSPSLPKLIEVPYGRSESPKEWLEQQTATGGTSSGSKPAAPAKVVITKTGKHFHSPSCRMIRTGPIKQTYRYLDRCDICFGE